MPKVLSLFKSYTSNLLELKMIKYTEKLIKSVLNSWLDRQKDW
jgi:hypothetical protein